MDDSARIDKWLWAVRIFKTRSAAAEACRAGKVRFSGNAVKPSREIKPGEVYSVSRGGMTKTLRVVVPLHNRVGAALAKNYVEDITPPEEIERARILREAMGILRPSGAGRPTKKERRDIDRFRRG